MLWQRRLLILVLAASAVFHLVAIARPDVPVFDEAHFATYASAYASDRAFIDIHPPLGKALFALPLVLSGEVRDREFLSVIKNKHDGTFLFSAPGDAYGSFPYVALRLVSALFGLLLIAAVYLFLAKLTGNETAALLAAFFIAFENALLVETRGIFLNGMYLAFGFAALAFTVGERARPMLAGILFGLALSIKLVAVVFVGPIIAVIFIRDFLRRDLVPSLRRVGTFLAAASVVFGLVLIAVNNVLLPMNDRITLYRDAFNYPEKTPAELQSMLDRIPAPLKPVINSVLELEISVSGYLGGVPPHPSQSTWYEWPFMRYPMPYLSGPVLGNDIAMIALVGNPVVWGLSTVAIVAAIVVSAAAVVRRKPLSGPLIFLVLGYLASLLPFMLVGRPAFLYHYFPALIFAIGALALITTEYLSRQPKIIRRLLGSVLSVATALGFVLALPYTYGIIY